jgi:PAS domain S-box-containing protein
MKRILSKNAKFIVPAVLLAAITGLLLWMGLGRSRLEDRVYKIGWESDPPFQAMGAEGQPTGLAVELVREAARRRGVHLEWLQQTGSSEAALRDKKVELWPLITITPERKKFIHITDPYLESEQCLLVRADSPYTQIRDLDKAKISYFDLPMNYRELHAYLPHAELLARSTLKASIEDVCQQNTAAVFLEEYTAISALMSGLSCTGQPTRMIPIPGARPRLGIGATFEARAAADAIREEIGAMAVEGRLAEVLSHWSYFSNRNLESLDALLNAKRRERWLVALSFLFASLFVLTLWQTVRIQRERNRTRLAERALRQREEKFRAIVETTKEWIWAIDLKGCHTYSNPAVENILGFSSEEWLNRDARDFVHPEDVPKVEALLREKIVAKDGWSGIVLRWRHKDGSYRYLESSAAPMVDGQGSLIGFQGADRDITERIKAEELRSRLEAQLRQSQKMEAFGQLAGGIAHDFNNMLTVINGYSEFLAERLNKADPLMEYVKEIRQAGERAAGLTRQLLTFSRRRVVQAKDLDLNEIVGNMIKMFQRVIGEHIALETHFAPGGAPLRADPGMIEQVLMNLAVNARDAMPKGGRLTLRTAAVNCDSAAIATHPKGYPGSFIRLTVTDSGCGIAPEILPHIFEPFFTTKEVGKGTGLGLATVFGIVEQHKGWIEVESQVGTGTTFSIYLPSLVGALATESEKDPASSVGGGMETILLVEDEGSVRELTRKYLERSGYRVLDAVSGPAALELWRQHGGTIDLMMTDMMMPGGITGLDLAERLQQEKPSLKIVYSSGYSEEALGRDFLSRGDIWLLQKPYSPDELDRAVRNALDAGRSPKGHGL